MVKAKNYQTKKSLSKSINLNSKTALFSLKNVSKKAEKK